VIVCAKSDGQTYEGKSDQQGKFQIAVPPGRYDVAIVGRFVQYNMNQLQHGTTKLALAAGQCAQFQFVPRENRCCRAARPPRHAPRIRPHGEVNRVRAASR